MVSESCTTNFITLTIKPTAMKSIFPLSIIVLLTACKPGKKEQPEAIKKNDSIVAAPVATKTTTADSSTVVRDRESLGPLHLGMPADSVIKIAGAPAKKTRPVEWGADGLLHEDWTWDKGSLALNFSSEKGAAPGTQLLFSITAQSPNPYKTKAGIGLGSSYEDIRAAYQQDINKEESTPEQVVVGSVYGGILFTLQQNKVTRIFVGAAAE